MATATDTAIITGTVEDATPPSMALVANPFERMALAMVERGNDLSKLDQLLDLQIKWDREQARKAYDEAMAACQAAMPSVYKDKYNEQTKSWYASLESVAKSAQPIYTRHGFSLSFNTGESKYPHHVLITCKCSHKAGHSEPFEYDQPLDDAGIGGNKNKTPTHARGSAISYGRRYLTMMVFNLATSDDDDGNASTKIKKAAPDKKADATDETLTDKQKTEQEAAAKEERKRQYFAKAYQENEDAVIQIKMKIGTDDIAGAARIWFSLTQEEQMALYLAPTKAGQYKDQCFTTAQRDIIKNKFTQYATKA